MSSFSVHYTGALTSLVASPISFNARPADNPLSLLDSCLIPPENSLGEAINILKATEQAQLQESSKPTSNEDSSLRKVVVKKVILGIYANALDLYLSEASHAQNEAEWWADIEQSPRYTAMYLLQTLPGRLMRVFSVIHTQKSSKRSSSSTLLPSQRNPPSRTIFQPSAFTAILFPYMHTQSSSGLVSTPSDMFMNPIRSRWSRGSHPHSVATYLGVAYNGIMGCVDRVYAFFYFPLRLARDECQIKRNELEKIRNKRAEVLGKLVSLRPQLAAVLDDTQSTSSATNQEHTLAEFLNSLLNATSITQPEVTSLATQAQDILPIIHSVYTGIFTLHRKSHNEFLDTRDLRRPSRIALLWPRLFLLPPFTFYCVRYLYASRASILDGAQETVETVRGFLRDWLLEPVKDVIKTIRTGGEEGIIVRKEAIAADLDSLERMTIALVKDKLGYSTEQFEELSRQIRQGDLTAVLKIYEEDIKSPFKSAVKGTLLRTAFVQIQKAKVDIDQALAGIDKLLKSQELTFAFVGVAPAFAVVYITGEFLKNLFSGREGRYGGKHKRMGVWLAMRRIERLLVLQPKSGHRHADTTHNEKSNKSESIPPLTSGLLVLSITHLREYALTWLHPRSRLREGFLEDVQDLEDPSLGRAEKLRVLDRMWKSWGEELGWFSMATGKRMR
ncbi:NCA2-domain-containing protein [Hygrophoropsis aurantiaca]|uniref:NCA2-domain-containing protein n=1 Tax=Hygrophoropsis aurantiaca TaxID=72124 RepID=A0ACB8ADY8_9AGAM|nr:NCA2-domain-containing protein [Hygrophoropsis aurantiaca]